jgi:1-acyl-sn-glycerol-3-phosphate acyltransferase
MLTIRSLAYLLVMALSVALYSVPLGLFGWAIPDPWLSRIGRQWAQLNLIALRSLCGLRYRVTGLEHFTGDSGIVLSKHQSAWETIAFLAILPTPQTWVIKQELLRVPLFGWSLTRFRPIAIDRSAGRKAVRQLLDQGAKALEEGRWVVIFPEGTRVPAGQRGRYGLGGAMLAERTGRPVVPIAHNAGVFWARRDVRKYAGVIEVVIGPPIETRGLRATEINRAVEEWIEETVARLPGPSPKGRLEGS